MLTSMVLLAIDPDNKPWKNFKGWIAGVINRGLGFVVLMLAFCRFDVIYNLTAKISSLMGFSGRSVSFAERIFQYTAFIRNCFLAPDAGINVSDSGVASWQQLSSVSVSFFGIVILLLSTVGFYVNRNKTGSCIAAGWMVFSAGMLLILGWGTAENGLILYSLYFGWAFCVLIFQLMEAAGRKLKARALVPVCSIGAAAAMALYNIPAVMELVSFAVAYYPA